MAAIAAAALAGASGNNGAGGEVKVKAPRKSNNKPRGGGVNGIGNGVPRDYNSAPKPLVSYNDSNERGVGGPDGGLEEIDRRLSINKRSREMSEEEDVNFEDDGRMERKVFDDQPKRKKESSGQRVETLQDRIGMFIFR